MEILRFLFKCFVICIVIAAVIVASISIYLTFFGKSTVEDIISKAIGSKIKYDNMSLDLNRGVVNFEGFTVLKDIDFEENLFSADRFVVSIDKERFDKDKTLVLEEIFIENGTLTIERNRQGVFNILPSGKEIFGSSTGKAYAADFTSDGNFYNLAKSFKSIEIKDSFITFKDYYISDNPVVLYCDKFNFEFRTSPLPGDSVGAACRANLNIPMREGVNGSAGFKSDMAIYPDRVDWEGVLETKHINLMLFLPYFDKYTPFYFNSGLFSSTTHVRVHNRVIDSPTVMLFNNLRLGVKPGNENAQFLQTAVNRLAPYLMSQQGDLYFDFAIKGAIEKPQAGLGPKVKYAIGMVALEELSKAMQQIQKLKK